MNTATATIRLGRVSGRMAETLRSIADGVSSHAWLYAAAAIVQVCALAESLYLGRPYEIKLVLFSLPLLAIFMVLAGFVLLFKELIRLARTGHQGSAFVALGKLVIHDFLAPERLANILHASVPTSFFMAGFLTLKNLLPEIHPFAWDSTLMEWDRVLHFGFHPYQILQPILGYPLITQALNYAYNAWFFFMITAWLVTAYARRDTALRQRFLLAFVLCWFIGTNVLGTIFSSVGPCFYGRLLGGEDPFQPLMSYLNQAGGASRLMALGVQDLLWDSYLGGPSLVKGISAMPSMHVATCVLLALLCFAAGQRWFGRFFLVFTATIFVASIHLAWHYAIDGYVGAAVALVTWFVAGQIVQCRPAKQEFAKA
jgi:hypothetical protein